MYAGRILSKGFAKKRERLRLELRARGGKGVAGCLYSPSCREGKFSETRLPISGVLGNWASGVRNSRKLNFYHYSFSETLYVGVVLYLVDRGCMHELPVYGVLGNWASDIGDSRKLGFRC